jgi:hypothetical protein
MNDPRQVSRRQFIVGGVGAASLAMGAGALIPSSGMAHMSSLKIPLPYFSEDGAQPVLDPDDVRYFAFNHYFQGGCMHGAASGLMQAFKEAFAGKSTGWDMLPYGMYKYGSGGVAGWGTLCGILNGCMAVLNLVGLHGTLGNELMGWYATTLFPTGNCEGFVADTGQVAIPDADVLARTVADSPLCHISISKWCQAAGVSVADKSPEGLKYKDDRCGKICADTAAKTAELINEHVLTTTLAQPFETPEPYASCLACHGERKDMVGKMDCLSCHSPSDVVMVSRRHPGNTRK